jgi:hypothetical protein
MSTNMQNLLLIQTMFMTGGGVPTKSKQVYAHRRPKRRLLRQFNRQSKNPARSNRHLFTMKDMRA